MKPLPTIAVVDDDDGVRTSLCSLLRSLGYAVRSYAGAQAFLDQTNAQADCLVTDLQMPGMDGEQLQATLSARGQRTPMIFMTAFPSAATQARVLAAGAHGFMEKPVDGQALALLLTQLLKDR